MEMKNGTHIRFLFCSDILLVICTAQGTPIPHGLRQVTAQLHTECIFLSCFIIKISKILSGYILMLCQVIICTVCDTPKFAPSKREQELDIGCRLAVERQALPDHGHGRRIFIFFDVQVQTASSDRSLSSNANHSKICIRLAEELKLHLLKLSGTECKVTRCDLVTERFSDLTDTKRNLLSGCSLYIFKVYENTLCCLRSEDIRYSSHLL